MERALEELVWRRAGGCCEYCRMPHRYDDAPFEIDHIIAVVHGGPTRAPNLCLACFSCNNFKGPNLAGVDRRQEGLFRYFTRAGTNGLGISAGTGHGLSAGLRPAGRPSLRCGST